MADARAPQASITTLRVLNLLLRHFAHGLTNGEIAKTEHLSPSMATRHVQALEAAGFAERVPETGRIRPSVRLAQHAVGILQSLETASNRMTELRSRITTTQ